MGKERQDIELILLEALEKKSPQERTAYLDEACGDDVQARAELESLLKFREQAGDFLNSPPFGANVTLDSPPISEGPGTVIGRYKLLEQIGEGGFGVVYMADQAKPISRRVALKIIKLGMDTKEVIARFEAERQALAMMDHPNIARVLDAGATDTGRPYFVMELVKGIPITEYCDKNNLDTRQRLELFITICKAIQHAHQKGIIHRDLKPSNVMITLHDGRPVPKVIDFGIAKATGQRLTEKTLFTRFAQMIGTPEYMSPEQAEFSGLDVDTRSDIYSLGVLLYQLLTGVTPFDGERLREAGYAEMQRIIREDDPDKPSTKLSTMGEALTEIARRRRAAPEALRRLIRGDLDWIVMKTLEKDRTRRYETASELAADIERHLANELVLAGPPSAMYRVRKFVRRNRVSVMAGSLIVVALAAAAVVSALYAREATLESLKAEEAREHAVEAKYEVSGLLAASYVDRAQALCEQGEVGRGMLWLAESLKVAPEDSRDLDRAVRTSLAAWYGQLHSLRAVVRYPAVQFPPVQRPPLAGSFTEGPLGSYTMTGSGTDIWGTADQFHFAYKTLTGPGSVAVRVDRLENTHEWAKAGVMIRDTTAPDSAFAAVFITPENRVCLQYRLATGQNALSIHTDPNAITLPHWIRLVREGNTFKAQHSEDGRQWKDLKGGSTFPVTTTRPAVVNVDLNDSIRVGLALTSHTEAERCQAVFSDFRTTGSVSAEWAHQDIHGDANVTKSPYPRQINSVTFSSDGSRLLVGRQDRAIWICDSSTGESISKPLYHGSPVTEVAASPHGKRIAARGLDGSLRLWDAATLEPVGELLHHEMGEARGCSMAFSPDGSWLRTEGAEGIAHYWDADTGTSLDKTLPTAFAAGDFWIDGVRVYKGDYVALDGDNSPRHGNAVNLLANGGFEAGAIEPWSTHGDIRAEVVGDLMNAAIPEDVVEGSSCLHVVVPEVGANYWDAGLWHTGHSFKAGTKYTLSLFLKSRAGLQDINVRLVLGADPSTCLDQKTVTITERWAEYSLTTPVLPEDIGPASITFHCVGEGKRDAVAMASCSEGLRVVRRMDWSKYQMFDGDRGRPIGPPVDNTGSTTALAISPDGSRFATIKIHSLIQIWDAATAEPLFDPIVQGGAIYALAFSPDGSRLVSAGNTRIAMLWDAATGEPIGAPLRQRDTIRTAAFSPDGRRVATGNQDGVLRIWDVIRDKCVSKSVVHEDPILGVACGPDGFRMLTETDGAIQVRDAATGKPIGRPIPHPGRIDFIVFSPDGARLATSSRTDTDDAWYVRLYDLARGELVGKPFHRGTARMAFSPDGSRILTGGWDNVVRLWDVATLGCLGEFHQHQRPVSAVAYSPNGSQFLTGSYDGTTQLWNAATLEPIGTPLVHQSEVKDAEFSPDGTQFLIGFADGTVRLWDAATRKPVGTPLQQLKVVSNVAFSPDGSRLLACCIDRTARLWDSATLKPIGPPLEHESWWPTMSSFSPDGSEILVADRYPTAAIWQAPPDPLGGDYERTVCWVQVVTGLELDPTGGINVLDAPTWQQRCRRLQELGGPPEVILSRL